MMRSSDDAVVASWLVNATCWGLQIMTATQTGASDARSPGQRPLRARYGPWALIAGASDGVGAEFARQVAASGINCILVARRLPLLDQLAQELKTRHGVEVITRSLDLSQPDAANRMLMSAEGLEVGLFIYNAGADPFGTKFLETSVADWGAVLRMNVNALLECCHGIGKRMLGAGRGGIIVVSSEAAFSGTSRLSVYSATKAFGLNLGESLWAELSPAGVDVLSLVLGPTDTPTLRRTLSERNVPLDAVAQDLAAPPAVVRAALERLGNEPTLVYRMPADLAVGLESAALRRKRIIETSEYMDLFYGRDT
jgi:short-subunit dehydrogenase